jgi:recombination protein RecA
MAGVKEEKKSTRKKSTDIMELLTLGSKDKKRQPRFVDPDSVIKFYSWGSLKLDMAYGGLPRGRVTEIFGQPNAGKTLLAMLAAKEQIDNDRYVLWIDMEQVFDHVWARKIGLDTSKRDKKGNLYFTIIRPDNAEDALTIFKRFIENPVVDLIVFDSLAALNPQAEAELDVDKSTMGVMARYLARFSRIAAPALASNPREPAVLCINQIRDNMDPYSKTENTPGGKAIRFLASLRLAIKAPLDKPSADKMDILQMNIHVVCRKTKVGVFRKETFQVTLDKDPATGMYHLNLPQEIFAIAKRYGIFRTRKGEAWKSGVAVFEGQELGKSEKEVLIALSTDYDLFTAVYAASLEAIASGTAQVDSEEGEDAGNGPEPEEHDDELDGEGPDRSDEAPEDPEA